MVPNDHFTTYVNQPGYNEQIRPVPSCSLKPSLAVLGNVKLQEAELVGHNRFVITDIEKS